MSYKYEVVDDDDVEVWVESEWIRPDNPRIYPTNNVPAVVARQRDTLVQLPPATDSLLPHDFMSVFDLIDPSLNIPVPRSDVLAARVSFSYEVPDSNAHRIVQALGKRTTMPPRSVVQKLANDLNQEWFDGKKSIVDTHFVEYLLPFWVIFYWTRSHFIHDIRMRWRGAEECIRNVHSRNREISVKLRHIADSLVEALRTLAWHAPLAGFPSAGWRGELELLPADFEAPIGWTTTFIQFFEKAFLDDEAINMMLHWIRLQVQRNNTLYKTTIICNLAFTNALLRNYTSRFHPAGHSKPMLLDCEDAVKSLGRKRAFIIFNVKSEHWVSTMINFDERTHSYGDSLAPTYTKYQEGINALDYWLNTRFSKPGRQPFKATENLRCGRQADGISCGIAACTTISSQLGLDDTWSAETATLSRYTWASRLIRIHQTSSTHGYVSAPNQEPTHVLGANNTSQLQTKAPPNEAIKSTSRMDIASILCTSTPESVEQPPDATVEPTQECLDSKVSEEPIDFTPYDSPSPLSTNNQGFKEDRIADVMSVDYIDRDGVLHFADTDDEYTPGSGAQPPEIPYVTNNYGKHPRSPSPGESSENNTPKRRAVSKVNASNRKSLAWNRHLSSDRQSGPTGISKTAVADRKRMEAVKAGDFKVDHRQATGLLQRAREIDPEAILDPEDTTGRYLIHSLCGARICLDGVLRTSKFKRHHDNCKSNGGLRKNGKFTLAAKGSLRIDTLFKKVDKSSSSTGPSASEALSDCKTLPLPPTSLSPMLVICRGLRTAHDPRIQAVLDRSQHGGATSIQVIAQDEYGKPFSDLTEEQKSHVRAGSAATAEWRVHLDPSPHIRHKKCRTKCDPAKSSVSPPDICTKCAELFITPSFQRALSRKPVEDPKNRKFVPHVFRNKNQGILYAKYFGLEEIFTQADSKLITPLMQYVHLVLQGKITEKSTFFGIMQAIVAKEDRLARGKGMQNMRYSPGYIDFCSIAHSMSSQAYRFLKDSKILVLGERDIRKRRSKAPGLPIGICERTFERAASFINVLRYSGPVSICCDDTKLLAKWIPHYDGASQKWLVLGGVGDPIQVDGSVEDVHDLLVKATEGKEKASKLRVWCLQAAAPKIPVLVLAALPISSSVTADKLFTEHSHLMSGLLDAGICVTSYACDGSATERKVTRLFRESASKRVEYSIPHPEPGFLPHTVSLYFYGPQLRPIVSIQDSKHALKTCRNVLFSGTHSLTIGNCVLHYQQLLALSKHRLSPLYQRDVVKIDRQDDRAALRLFSSAMIRLIFTVMEEQQSASNPDPILGQDLRGLVVYLFIIGDFIDVFQNRFLSNSERLKIVLRTHHFLQIWESSLASLGYSNTAHFITRDAREILQYLIDGFIALVLVHRDHLDYDNYPLTPWLHSTEPAEHTFGEARRCVPDFTVSDFVHLNPKLMVRFEAAAKNGEFGSDSNARAAGYFHTQYSDKGIDIAAISVHPPDSVFAEASRLGFHEAKLLYELCGIALDNTLYAPAQVTAPLALPSFGELLSEITDDCDSAYGSDSDGEYDMTGVNQELHDILEYEDSRGLGPAHLDDKMELYSLAAVALEVESRNEVDSMPDQDNEESWRALVQEVKNEYPRFPLPPLVIADEVRQAASRLERDPIDTKSLVDLRSAHETLFAKKAVRTGTLTKGYSAITVSDDADLPENAHSARQKLVRSIHETLREIEQSVGTGTGTARRLRHQTEAGTKSGEDSNRTGTTQAVSGRITRLKNAKVNSVDLIGRAGISGVAPIQTGCYAIVYVEGQLWLSEVLTMYSKSAGKGANHAWVESATSVASLSYILIRLWEHWKGSEFRSLVKSTAMHHALRYAHIPWQRLLYVTRSSSVKGVANSGRIQANSQLLKVWNSVCEEKEKEKIAIVVEGSLRRVRNTAPEQGDE
ncbi:hypothetical protein FRC12_007479 [Ceratobasidium sp. 428]|nr:hypothetical protein FRC12_007479 [Ceratobasidium sp. 428]